MELIEYAGLLILLVLSVSVLIASGYLYIFFSHDQEIAFPGMKYIVFNLICSMFVAFMILILIPFDLVSNVNEDSRANWGFSIGSEKIWIGLVCISLLVFFLNIFWYKYYVYHNPHRKEERDYEIKARVFFSLKTLMKIGLFLVLIQSALFLKGDEKIIIPYHNYVSSISTLCFSEIRQNVNFNKVHLRLYNSKFSPSLYIVFIGPFIFYGSILFFILGGFGLAALPLKFFTKWSKKPTRPNAEKMVLSNILLREKTENNINKLKKMLESKELIDELKHDHEFDKALLKTKVQNFEFEILKAQEKLIDFEALIFTKRRQENILNENPLKYLVFLLSGILTLGLSLMFICHSICSMFGYYFIMDNVFFTVEKVGTLYSILVYFLFSSYLLFCAVKGFEEMSQFFPTVFGHNQIKSNRTWLDTWILIVHILVPSAWAVIGYFLQFVPNYFAFMYASRLIKIFVNNTIYMRFFLRFRIFRIIFVFSFVISMAVNLTKSILTEELDLQIAEKKEILKKNQLIFQSNFNEDFF